MSIKKMLLGAVAVSVVSVGLVSCGGKKTAAAPSAVPGSVEVVSTRGEFIELANEKYDDQYWGIGEGVSNREAMAADVAATRARAEILVMIQTELSRKVKDAGLNSLAGEAVETYARRIVEETQGGVTDARQRKSKTMLNQSNGQYTVTVLMTASKDAADAALKRKMVAENAINDAEASKIFSEKVDAILD